jgi:hypothetical protein
MKRNLANHLEILLLIIITLSVLFVAFSVRSKSKDHMEQCRIMSNKLDRIDYKLSELYPIEEIK